MKLVGEQLGEDQVWAIAAGGKQLQVADFPIRVMEEICRETETNYGWVCLFPFADLRVAEKLIFQACRLLEVDPPDFETLSLKRVTDFFVQVPDDLPEVYEGGVPPMGDD